MWEAAAVTGPARKFPGILTDDELRAIQVPALPITGARSALLTPAEARARGSLMPHAEVAIVPGSHGRLNQIDELNDRIAAFIDPAGLTKLDARFWWWLSISGLATLTPMPLRRRLARWLDSPAMLERS